MAARQPVYFECPHCGENVLVGSKVCRECGASDESGWNEDDFGDGYDDVYDDPIYQTADSLPGDRHVAADNVRFWVRLVILGVVVSFLLSMGVL